MTTLRVKASTQYPPPDSRRGPIARRRRPRSISSIWKATGRLIDWIP